MTDDNIETNDHAPRQDNVVSFFNPKGVTSKVTPSDQNTPDSAVVKLLEDYLEAAKEGKITFVAIASVDNTGVALSTWEPEGAENPALITQALGAVSFLNTRFGLSCNEGAELDDTLRD